LVKGRHTARLDLAIRFDPPSVRYLAHAAARWKLTSRRTSALYRA